MAFDTLIYAKKLQAAGFTPQQAEAQAEGLCEVVEENLATKRDLKEVRECLIGVFGSQVCASEGPAGSLRRELNEIEGRLITKMDQVTRDIVVYGGGVIVSVFTAYGVMFAVSH